MHFQALTKASVLLTALVALTLGVSVGCEGEGEEGEPEPTGGCTIDRDCGGGSICDKTNDGDDIPAASDPEGVCIRIVCLSNADCGENEVCDLRRGICVPDNLCDPGDPAACSGGELCQYVDGLPLCAAAPAAAECTLNPTSGFIAAGSTMEFEGVGQTAAGKLVPHTTFTYAASAGTFAGSKFTAGAAGGDVTITGTTVNGGASCTATVKVYAAVPAADLRVVVIDQAARAPLANTKVAARIGGVSVDGLTDATGAATFTGGAVATSVSVFPDNHQWQTVLSPGTNDIILYTAPVQNVAQVDGIKGGFDFGKVKTRGDIKLGLAGMSINAAITDLNFDAILGELVPTTIDIEGITDPGGQDVTLPEGLVIGLGEEDFKADYVALTDKSGGGVAWALAGRVALSDVGPIISSVAGADDLDFGAILGAILPFFAKFDHAVVTGLDFDIAARNDANFENVTIAPNTLLGLSANLTMPTLPCAPGAFAGAGCTQDIFLLTEGEESSVVTECPAGAADCEPIAPFTSGAVVISGVVVPGQGLVPLGITAGLDVVNDGDDPDGKAEQAGDFAPDAGTLLLDYAPPHDGIEGNLYVTVAIALDINQITGADDLGASIVTKVSRNLPTPPAANAFANGFLQSQGGTFTPGAAGSFTLAKKGADASFYRVNLDNNGDQEWNVWFDDADGFDIADLAVHSGVTIAPRTAHADVQAFTLGAGYDGEQPADFDDLFAFDGQDIDNLLYYLGAWSSESCKAGGICAVQ